MEQMKGALTVSQLNRYVKSIIENDGNLRSVLLMGEISNFTNHYRSGHLYFSLKDSTGTIKAVMFSSAVARLRFMPEDGMQVVVRGRVSLYEQTGSYQFYAEEMQPAGLGALNLAYEKCKEKLEKEGLFDRKRPIPRYPKRVGVITSPTGAAVRDILQILKRRWPLAEVVFCPVSVQGDSAAPELAAALMEMNRKKAADVIIIGRGGGSIEDLWAFNEEIVARAVAASDVPVISAVGHETDFTICDFAADLRAPTPSAAAELAVPDRREEWQKVLEWRGRMRNAEKKLIALRKDRLTMLAQRPVLRRPEEILLGRKLQLDALESRMSRSMSAVCGEKKEKLSGLAGKLDGMSPLKTLARGYALVQKDESVVKAADLKENDSVTVRFFDGKARCKVEGVSLEE